MFSLFLFLNVQYLGIDFGSEYIKTAESTISGEPKMRFSPSGQNYRAAAAARKPQFVTGYNSSISPEQAQMRYGQSALSILKKHPESGYEFLPRVIGRFNTSFHTSNIFSSQELMVLYLQNFMKSYTAIPTVIGAVPSYWTHQMKMELASIIRVADIPFNGLIEDKTAVANHYAVINHKKFVNQSRNVLFVDVGATSVKAYGYIFNTNGTHSFANETVYEWSENSGSYFFAKKISEARHISMKKAQRFFRERSSSEYIDDIKVPLEEFISVLNRSVQSFKEVLEFGKIFPGNSKVIDEVQVFGGASKVDVITKAIKQVVNDTKILYEFNQNEAIAKGIIYQQALHDQTIQAEPVIVNNVPTATLLLATDTKFYIYCRKSVGCQSPLIFSDDANTTTLRIIAHHEHRPEGCLPIQEYIELTNLTALPIPHDDYNTSISGQVFLRMPFPEITYTRWCLNDTCYPIQGERLNIPKAADEISSNYSIAATELNKNQRVRMGLYKHVEEMISSTKEEIDQKLESKGLVYEDIPADVVFTLNKYLKKLEDGSLMESSAEALHDAETDLKINSKYVIDAVNRLKPKKNVEKDSSADDIFNDLKNDYENEL